MIFVTVGTHEQQFNRLVEYMDEWAKQHDEEVVIQTGYSTYEPKKARWQKFYGYKEISELVNEARIVITHGGPSSFFAALQIGKVPVVVPRKKELEEHINNHQINFCREVANRQKNIIEIEDINELGHVIDKYDEIVASLDNGIVSNNAKFCEELEKIVDEIID